MNIEKIIEMAVKIRELEVQIGNLELTVDAMKKRLAIEAGGGTASIALGGGAAAVPVPQNWNPPLEVEELPEEKGEAEEVEEDEDDDHKPGPGFVAQDMTPNVQKMVEFLNALGRAAYVQEIAEGTGIKPGTVSALVSTHKVGNKHGKAAWFRHYPESKRWGVA